MFYGIDHTYMANTFLGLHSPWGVIDNSYTVAPGITSVSTPSHGGLLLSQERQAAMPDAMKQGLFYQERWYEEDCEWAKVFVTFADEIKAYALAHPEDPNSESTFRALQDAPRTLQWLQREDA